MPIKNIAEILKSSRKTKGFSTAAVCNYLKSSENIDISPSTLYGYENGNRSPSNEILLALCDLYEIDNVLAAFGYGPGDKIATSDGSLLLSAFNQLNSKGQQVAVERVEELTKIPDYQKEKPQDEA